MKKCPSIFLTTLLILPLLINTSTAVDCFSALQKILPCQPYLIFGSSRPTSDCCNGVKDLAEIAHKSKSERQSLCWCLESAARSFPINQRKAKALPRACHVNLNITISPHMDCTKA